jgi:hypothetical protein
MHRPGAATAAGFVEEFSCAAAGWREDTAIQNARAIKSKENLFFL